MDFSGFFRSLYLLFVFLIISFPVLAITDFLEKAERLNLANDPVWLKLLHYEAGSINGNEITSAVHADSFFLSETGRTNSRSELEATINTLIEADANVGDQSVQCRFPARTLWLDKKLGLYKKRPSFEGCEQYQSWLGSDGIESISIVFATGYLGNPASYYGHTLLKFNSKNSDSLTSLLDTSVNYGAIVPPKENPIVYVFKGIFGGYDAGFSHVEYYFHTHNYGENELRDLWEYELNLPSDAVDFIVAHAWEVLGKEYSYYFFRRNCAYRMAELVELIEGVDIIPETPFFTIPQSLIKKLSSAKIDGRDLVKDITYHPSRQSRLYSRYESLRKHDKKNILEWVNDKSKDKRVNLVDANQIDTLMDYYQYLSISDQIDKLTAEEEYRKLLSRRFELPPQPSKKIERPFSSPDEARDPSRISFGLVSGKNKNDVEIQLRPAYYDRLDADAAHVKNSLLGMADLTLRLNESHVQVHKLDFVNIISANSAVTGLPGDNSDAWMLYAGLVRQNSVCSDCLVMRFEGALGQSVPLSEYIDLTALAGGTLQERKHGIEMLHALFSVSLVANLTPSINLLAESVYRRSVEGDGNHQRNDLIELRYKINSKLDFRFKYSNDNDEELLLSLGSYW